MKLKEQKGVTGIDIAISIVVLFIFVSLIASLIYNYNVSVKESARKTQALDLAINEIENIKKEGFLSKYEGINSRSTTYADGTVIEKNKAIEDNEGFFKTVSIMDYTDISGKENEEKDIVKKITVKISYMSNWNEENIELSTIITKENV